MKTSRAINPVCIKSQAMKEKPEDICTQPHRAEVIIKKQPPT